MSEENVEVVRRYYTSGITGSGPSAGNARGGEPRRSGNPTATTTRFAAPRKRGHATAATRSPPSSLSSVRLGTLTDTRSKT